MWQSTLPRVSLFTSYRQFACDIQVLLVAMGVACRRTIDAKRRRWKYEYLANELTVVSSWLTAINPRKWRCVTV
jgi:intein/homing endonuclease